MSAHLYVDTHKLKVQGGEIYCWETFWEEREREREREKEKEIERKKQLKTSTNKL